MSSSRKNFAMLKSQMFMILIRLELNPFVVSFSYNKVHFLSLRSQKVYSIIYYNYRYRYRNPLLADLF